MITRLKGHAARWLGIDLSYAISGGGWMATGQLIAALTGLATAYVFANFLPPEAYGTYKYVLAGAVLLAIPALHGMNTAVLQAVARNEDGTVLEAMRRRFRFGLIGTVVGVGIAAYYLIQGDTVLGYGFLTVAIGMPIVETLTTSQSVLQGKHLFAIAARQSVLTSLLSATSVIAAIFLTRDPLWIIIAYILGNLIGRFITYLIAKRLIENTTVSQTALRFGMHASVTGVLGVISANADIFVLWHATNPETLALYAFALAAIMPFQALVKSTLNLAHPKFAAHERGALIDATKRRVRQAFFLLTPVVLVAVLALPILFALLFPLYVDAVPFAQVIALSVLLYPEKLYGIALTAAQQTKALYGISITGAITRIAVFAVFIPLLGAWGAVAALLAQQLVTLAATRYFFYRMESAYAHASS